MIYKKHFTDLPTWEDIILLLNYVQENNIPIFVFENLGFRININESFSDLIPKIEEIRKHIHKFSPNKICDADIYISMLTNSGTYGRHKDQEDVYFILASGKMKFIIEDNEPKEYLLEPGDMLYLPAGKYHTPIPLTPRIGISIGLT